MDALLSALRTSWHYILIPIVEIDVQMTLCSLSFQVSIET